MPQSPTRLKCGPIRVRVCRCERGDAFREAVAVQERTRDRGKLTTSGDA